MRTAFRTLGIVAACLIVSGSQAPAADLEARRCAVVKLKAVIKEAKDKEQCYERALKSEVPVSSDCLSKAASRRDHMFERAEERGGCATEKDGAGMGSRVDSFVGDVTRALLVEKKPTPSPKPSPSPEASSSPGATGGKKEAPKGDVSIPTATPAEPEAPPSPTAKKA